jgi:hypothetical protein
MEKRIPEIIAAWLAGKYDRDTQVARAAKSGQDTIFDTPTKVNLLWTKWQQQVLDYVQSAMDETTDTLSDERITSADDAEAKYHRVIGSCLSLLLELVSRIGSDETTTHEKYGSLLSGNQRVWEFIQSPEPYLRRTTSELLSACVKKLSDIVSADLEIISNAFVVGGLKVSQNGSSLQFISTLVELTEAFPNVWTASSKTNKSPLSKLQRFLKKGSQGGPEAYWQLVSKLLLKLPSGILPADANSSLELLKALRAGVCDREESLRNALSAWHCYLQSSKLIIGNLSTSEDRMAILSGAIYPIFERYLKPSSENNDWNLRANEVNTAAKAYTVCMSVADSGARDALNSEWVRLADILITDMFISQPQQSSEYDTSQLGVISESDRFFALQDEIVRLAQSNVDFKNFVLDSFSNTTKIVVDKSIELLNNRNGKPYGAAAVLKRAVLFLLALGNEDSVAISTVSDYLQGHLPGLIGSPSSNCLVEILVLLRDRCSQLEIADKTWTASVDTLFASENISNVQLSSLLKSSWGPLAQSNDQLQQYVLAQTSLAVGGDEASIRLLESAFDTTSLTEKTADDIIRVLTSCLDDDDQRDGALRGLEMVQQKQRGLLANFTILKDPSLFTKLLSLNEQNDELDPRISALQASIDDSYKGGPAGQNSRSLTMNVIRDALETAGPQSLG